MKSIKYFCRTCQTVKECKTEIVDNLEKEIWKDFPIKVKQSDGSFVDGVLKTRQLECGHRIPRHIPGISDATNENLNEWETAEIRRTIDKEMLGKNFKELEQAVLFHAEQYTTLLKIASKQKQQAKYAQQYIAELAERYEKTLGEQEQKDFKVKFAHFLDLKPTTQKTIERERNKTEKQADKQDATLEKIRQMLLAGGHNPKDLFKEKKVEEGEQQ